MSRHTQSDTALCVRMWRAMRFGVMETGRSNPSASAMPEIALSTASMVLAVPLDFPMKAERSHTRSRLARDSANTPPRESRIRPLMPGLRIRRVACCARSSLNFATSTTWTL